jgi:hypothetical protein
MSFTVAVFLMLLQHRPRSDFLGTVTIASRPLRTLFYMFILSLLLCTYTAKMFLSWHRVPFHNSLRQLFDLDFQASPHNTPKP